MIVSFFIHLKNSRIPSFYFSLRPVPRFAKLMLQVSHHFNRRPNKASFGCWGSLCARLHSLLAWTDKEKPSKSSVSNRHSYGIVHSKEDVIEEFPTFIFERGASSRPKKARASLPFRHQDNWRRWCFEHFRWSRKDKHSPGYADTSFWLSTIAEKIECSRFYTFFLHSYPFLKSRASIAFLVNCGTRP